MGVGFQNPVFAIHRNFFLKFGSKLIFFHVATPLFPDVLITSGLYTRVIRWSQQVLKVAFYFWKRKKIFAWRSAFRNSRPTGSISLLKEKSLWFPPSNFFLSNYYLGTFQFLVYSWKEKKNAVIRTPEKARCSDELHFLNPRKKKKGFYTFTFVYKYKKSKKSCQKKKKCASYRRNPSLFLPLV
jgi:hypothetical protein